MRDTMILPSVPPAGARVALVAAAGPLPEGGVERATSVVRRLGWEPVLGTHAQGCHGYLAGTDAERHADLQNAIDSVDAEIIWLLRGGYGTMRILPALDLRPLRERPRPLIGFSDNTALHLAAHREGVVSFHGPHPASADLSDFSISALLNVLRATPAGVLPFPADGARRAETITEGVAEGLLVGGNLSLLAATIGTPYQLEAAGAILFVEEVGEPAYRLDRLLTQLLLSGVLRDVTGIAVGAICGANEKPGELGAMAVIRERLKPLGVPIAYGFPFGHIPRSWTLPLGVRARLDASAGSLELLAPALSGS